MIGRTGGATDTSVPIRGLEETGFGRGEAQRPSGIVEPRRAERVGSDERNEAFGGGAGAADAANPLRAAVRLSGRNGVLLAKIAVCLRVRLAQLDRGASCWSSDT